jgi:hypothetical protein
LPEYDTRGIPAFKGLRDAYLHFTGDHEVSGCFLPDKVSKDLRACADFNANSFAYALQNALSMYLSKMYKEFPYHEDVLISERRRAEDFRQIHSVQLGYLDDLPDVDPEDADYHSVESYDDTEAQYNLSHKGAILRVTRRHVLNDSIGVVKAMIKRMARAANKAHARYVWNFFIQNSTCPDGTSWFTPGHGNLGSDALDFSPLVTAITALVNMEEPGPSTEKIGLDLSSFNWHLVVPIGLWDLAVKKNQAQYLVNDLSVPNPCYRLFGDHNERIIVCPFLTNTNDWGIIRDSQDVPIVEMSYYAGKEDPEFILEEGASDEQVFIADKYGYKVRHEYGGTLADYRGGYKSIVS